ncbi:MAG: amidohydrolase family protein [Acetobacteraceae bacterium]|nr:amidohydrolase family protein [Acetobacteraceae bacterium]
MKRRELIDVALGKEPADLVVRGGRLVDVHTAEIYPGGVAVKGDRICAVGQVDYAIGPKTEVLDAGGRHITPGLIETHQHVAGSHLSMTEFVKAVMPHGTTAIATDFYEIAVVSGVRGVRFCLDELKRTPLKVLFVIPMPALYQNDPFGHTGSLGLDDMKAMLQWPDCYGLNEAFAPRVLDKDPWMLELLGLTWDMGKVVVGHASEFRGERLQAWLAAVGDTNDHECVSAEEALEKARLGIRILLREGSAAADVVRVSRAITELKADPRRFAFCTDEEDPRRLVRVGHLDHKIRLAVDAGVDPVVAVQMATINAAECYRVDRELGSLAPGKVADLLLVEDLKGFKVSHVVANGRVVARDGRFVADLQPPSYPDFMYRTVRLARPVRPEDFRIAAPPGAAQARVRVIEAREGDLITSEGQAVLKAEGGWLEADTGQDVLKIAVFERHHATGKVGRGFIRGFGLKRGAIASTFNPHNEDLVVLGVTDREMALAANRTAELGGGFVVVEGDTVLAEFDLPQFGLLCPDPLDRAVAKLDAVYEAAKGLGCGLRGPFTSLGFMCLPVIIGNLKMCCEGLVNVWESRLVDPVLG